MSLKSQLKEFEDYLNKLKSDKQMYRSGLSLNHPQVKELDNVIRQMTQDYETLCARQEKINTCIKKHPLIQQIKKQSKALMQAHDGSLTLMQARNQVARDYHYQNWDDVIEKLFLELESYLENDTLSLTPQDNQMTIHLGKNQYAMPCYLKPEHWSAHLGLIDCPQLMKQFQLFAINHKVVVIGDEATYKTLTLSQADLSEQEILNLHSDENWQIWQQKTQGLAYINDNQTEIKKAIRHYLQERMKMNHRDNEVWLINSHQSLDMIEPIVIAQIRSFNIHLVVNYSSLSDFTHNEVMANNTQTQIFNTQKYNPDLLSSIFAYPLSHYQMPAHQSQLALIQPNQITEIA